MNLNKNNLAEIGNLGFFVCKYFEIKWIRKNDHDKIFKNY